MRVRARPLQQIVIVDADAPVDTPPTIVTTPYEIHSQVMWGADGCVYCVAASASRAEAVVRIHVNKTDDGPPSVDVVRECFDISMLDAPWLIGAQRVGSRLTNRQLVFVDSSGSTGLPKGAMHAHRDMRASLEGFVPTVVIDHHPLRETSAGCAVKIIEPGYGGTSTIVAER